MTLPGTEVISRDAPPSHVPPTDTGTWFVVGVMERGPAGEAVLVKNISQVEATFGKRLASNPLLYDALDAFFREGGSRAYIGREVGAGAVKATVNLSDGTANTLRADAANEGVWGNDIDLVVTHPGAGTFQIEIQDDGDTVESSPVLSTNAEAVAWAATSNYIRLTDLGGGDPTAATSSLATGADGGGPGDTEFGTALDLFTKDLGPGQVSAPGITVAAQQTLLAEHAESHNRIALLDLQDTATVATLISGAATIRALGQARYTSLWAPWAVVPGVSPGTERTVPYSAIQAGLIARSDASGKSVNIPAAGENGQSNYSIGLSQDAFTDADRELLNDAGVNVARTVYGGVRTYGYRTAVNGVLSETWLQLSNARLGMVIAAKADAVAERYVFSEIDGRGKEIAKFNGELVGLLLPYYAAGSLYGDSPEQAFKVDTGDQVNTDETIAARELHAVLSLRMSPAAERVTIEIVKSAITEAV
jgi:phage tail sheath protein FI